MGPVMRPGLHSLQAIQHPLQYAAAPAATTGMAWGHDAFKAVAAAPAGQTSGSSDVPRAVDSPAQNLLQQCAQQNFVFRAGQPAMHSQSKNHRALGRSNDMDGKEAEAGNIPKRMCVCKADSQEPSSLSIQTQLESPDEFDLSSSQPSISGTPKDGSCEREAAGNSDETNGARPASTQTACNAAPDLASVVRSASHSASDVSRLVDGRLSLQVNLPDYQTQHSKLISFMQRPMPDVAAAQQVFDSLRRKQAAFLKVAMDTLPWNTMSAEIVDISGYYIGIKPVQVRLMSLPVSTKLLPV